MEPLLLRNGCEALKWQDLTKAEQEFIENKSLEIGLGWLWVLRDGYISTIAFKRIGRHKDHSKRKLMVREAERFLCPDQCKLCCTNLRFSYMGGWKVFWDKDEDFDHLYPCNEWYQHSDQGPCAFRIFTDKDWDKFMKRVYPYYGSAVPYSYWHLKQYHLHKPYARFRAYMKNLPESELWLKMGFPHFALSSKMCHLAQKTRKRVMSWLKKNKADMEKIRKLDIPDFLALVKANMSIAEKATLDMMKLLHCDKTRAIEVTKYLKKAHQSADHYKDYLHLSRELGRDMEARGVWFPRDFDLQFREMTRMKKVEELRRFDKDMETRIRELNIAAEKQFKDGFSLHVITKGEDMFDIGEDLKICVGACGYDYKVATGCSVIMALKKDGRTVNCIELDTPKMGHLFKVLQNRGEHNRDSEYQAQSEKCVSAYIRQANKDWRLAHVS